MSYQAKIKRYLQILQAIEKSKFPTSAEMINRMGESGVRVSDRQLKRDLESLRGEFGLDIHYSASKKGYYLENEEFAFPYFLKLLEFSQNIELLTSYLKEGSDLSEIIEFEEYHSFKGLGYIRDIAFYIRNGSEVNLKYKRFGAEMEKEYSFHPYLLLEYLKRWYVIGLLSGTKEIRTFGLDRIISLQDSGKKFKKVRQNSYRSCDRVHFSEYIDTVYGDGQVAKGCLYLSPINSHFDSENEYFIQQAEKKLPLLIKFECDGKGKNETIKQTLPQNPLFVKTMLFENEYGDMKPYTTD